MLLVHLLESCSENRNHTQHLSLRLAEADPPQDWRLTRCVAAKQVAEVRRPVVLDYSERTTKTI